MSVFDSEILRDWFSTPEMREVFSDENTIQCWLDVEAALAAAEGEVGLLPADVAQEVATKAKAELISRQALREKYQTVGYPILPLLKVWEQELGERLARWVHWGATTQDITDTGMVLQLRRALGILEKGLGDVIDRLKSLADRHRDTLMAGRTHGQHAVPITFGFKVAIWVAELGRHSERLQALKPRLLVGQLAGAAGTLASLGDRGKAVQEAMMKRLGLGTPSIAWHSARDTFAELASDLAMLGSTLEKIAHEIEMLQKTEVAELAESHEPTKGASSTMPQKRNPATCEAIIALGRLLREQVPALMASMTQEHERDWWATHIEWKTLSEMCMLSSASLHLSKNVLSGLEVNAEKMRQNLESSRGLIMAEAVMMRLSEKVGRAAAHELLYDLSMLAAGQASSFAEALKRHPRIARLLSEQEIDELLNPTNYLGQTSAAIDRVLGGT